MPTRVYLVEDHAILQNLLSQWINKLSGIHICGVASSGHQALEEIAESKPDLVLTDVALPDISGLEVVKQLRMQFPQLPAIIHTSHNEQSLVRRAFENGAMGYLLKGNPLEIENAIHQVLNGKIYLSPKLRRKPEV